MGGHTPFFDRAARLAELRARFFVPGHKGNAEAIPPFADILPLDLTEVEGADDLSCPSGPLAESEANMARAYGSGASLYCAGGTTACIEAMLGLYLRPGGRVIVQRGCHAAAIRALVFTGAVPVWVRGAGGRVSPEELAPLLAAHPGVPVYLTSPDYYGRASDIGALAALCHAHDAPLLVDGAHGAHLRFLRPDRHPLSLGADVVADSAHKTLPVLTGGALLHLRDGALAARARQMLNLYSSTSPSYLVLESLDLCAGLLLEGKIDFTAAAGRLAAVAGGFAHLLAACDDPLKLCLEPARGGWEAGAVLDALRGAGMLPEFFDGRRIVLMAGPYNEPGDFALLGEVLTQFEQRKPLQYEEGPVQALPEMVCRPRDAFFGGTERLATGCAAGRVMAGIDAPCPPGVPLVAPGERIGEAEAAMLAAGGISAVDVLL